MAEAKWSSLDPVVHVALSQLKDRNVAALERLSIWPSNTIFHREAIPSGVERSLWVRRMCKFLEPADWVFVDPDNGLGPAKETHATYHEVETLGRKNRPVIIIKFPHHNAKYPQQLEELHRLFDGRAITTVMTTVWIKQPRATWFSIVNATELMNAAAQTFASRFNSIQHAKAEVHISTLGRVGGFDPLHLG